VTANEANDAQAGSLTGRKAYRQAGRQESRQTISLVSLVTSA